MSISMRAGRGCIAIQPADLVWALLTRLSPRLTMIIEFTHFCLNHVNVVMIFGSNDGRVGSANIWFHAGTSRRSDHPARPLYWRSCMKACSRTGTAGCYRAARTQGGAAVRLGPA